MSLCRHLTRPTPSIDSGGVGSATERKTMEQTMTRFTLERTGDVPVQFDGELIGSVASRNASIEGLDLSNRQWFKIAVYRTETGKFVSHVQYRAGSRLSREDPCDQVYVTDTGHEMSARLAAVDPVDEFVVGWPDFGSPQANGGRDFTRQDRSVCEHAELEWENVMEKVQSLLGEPEVIT